MLERAMKFAPALAAAAFVLALLAFYVSVGAYRLSVDADARRDLEARAELAAMTLAEPLRTQDFAHMRSFGESCRARGYELSVRTRGGGRFFDTRRKGDDSERDWIGSAVERGEYSVALFRRRSEVFAPLGRVYRLFLLAALAGAAGMLVFFFAFYRQRVRIRELARTERFRREFVADVSHEIKTPLTGILGAVEMLENDVADSETRRRLLAMVSKESKRLNALVQQILDLARLEREGDVIEATETDISCLVRDVVESMRPRAEEKGIALEVSVRGEPCIAKVDARLVGEAIENLVGNAIRHSGSPDVVVGLSRAQGGHAYSIFVEDHGIGIPKDHATRVFERFHRVDPARAAESGGAGLGLAIVRRIARLHGGDATLEPTTPHGCRFVFSVPVGK